MNTCPFCRESNPPSETVCERCGATLSPARVGRLPEGTRDDIVALIGEGRKIEAIRLFRERTGLGLKEAKDAVDAIHEGGDGSRGVAPPLRDSLLEKLRGGRKIEAIQAYREATGAGLKPAKDFVEALARQHSLPTRGKGCAPVLLLLILVVVMAALR
ncbi:MAG: ribosomal protein L7/L12 [Isosphaeraceae bacterium]